MRLIPHNDEITSSKYVPRSSISGGGGGTRLQDEASIFSAKAFQNKVIIPYNFNLKRSDQVVISRSRFGHSKLTHAYLLKGEQQPECIFCECP